MFQQTPVFSDIGKPFAFPVTTQGISNSIVMPSAYGSTFGSVELMPDQYFVFTAFRCFTNYDNWGGAFSTEVTTTPQGFRPFVPNNFTVQITQGSDSLFSQTPLSQAQICSSGYLAGKTLPIPSIYGPRETFRFEFTDLTGFSLLDADDEGIPLEIQMFMEGLIVPVKTGWPKFMNLFPALKAAGF
jgi:hypothetical protein